MIVRESTDPYVFDPNAPLGLPIGKAVPAHDHAIGRLPPTHPPMSFPDFPKQLTPVNDLAKKYPAYHKDVSDVSSLDVYHVHKLFNIQDPSGCIQHASKKLLLSGLRTGGKSVRKDIQEARDTLQRWLDLNPETV